VSPTPRTIDPAASGRYRSTRHPTDTATHDLTATSRQPVPGLLTPIGLDIGPGEILDVEADQVTAAVADELWR
jgi:hypothetical protein